MRSSGPGSHAHEFGQHHEPTGRRRNASGDRGPSDLTNQPLTAPPVFFRRFSDPEEYVASLRLGAARFQAPVARGYNATVMRAQFGAFGFGCGEASTAATVHGEIPAECVFMFDTAPGPERVLGGRTVRFGNLYHPASNDGYLGKSTGEASYWGTISVPYRELSAITVALTGRDLAPSRASGVVAHTSAAALRRMVQVSGRIGRIIEHDPARLRRPEMATVLSGLLGQILTACLLDGRLEPDLAATGRRRRIMGRLEEIGEAHVDEPLTLAGLCAALGVNARTLRLVAHEFVGMGPVQYLRMQRLNRARLALVQSDPRVASVGDIAAAFGFWESGRFAALYRATFGEMPGETLRRA